jgi:hypothetical protein
MAKTKNKTVLAGAAVIVLLPLVHQSYRKVAVSEGGKRMDPQANVVRRRPRWIALAWFITFGLAITIASPAAEAYHHEHDYERVHQKLIHFAATGHTEYDEDYCAQVVQTDGALSWSAFRDRLNYALLNQDPRHWDGAGNWKLDMYPTAYWCSYYADISWIEVRNRSYKYSHPDKPCADGISCVSHRNQVWTQVPTGVNHYDYLNEDAYFDEDDLTYTEYSWRLIINHEYGHVVGFSKPAWGDCRNSVVHLIQANGCPWIDIPAPTDDDLWVLANDVMLSKQH